MARILVVDDDAEFVTSVSLVLGEKGHTVATASNGMEGLAKAREQQYDLMLLDVMMNSDDEGLEIARKLHDDPTTRNLPVIIITGVRRAKHLPFFFEPDDKWLPVRAVLEKPVSPETLLECVGSALSQQHEENK